MIITQQQRPILYLITSILVVACDALLSISSISSHPTTKSSKRLFINSVFYVFANLTIPRSQAHVPGFRAWSSSHVQCLSGFLHSHWHLIHFCLGSLFLAPNSHLHSHEMCFASVFDSFFFYHTFRFTSSILLAYI